MSTHLTNSNPSFPSPALACRKSTLRSWVERRATKQKARKLGKVVFTLESDYVFGVEVRQSFQPSFINLMPDQPRRPLNVKGPGRSTALIALLLILLASLIAAVLIYDALAPSLLQQRLCAEVDALLAERILPDLPKPLQSAICSTTGDL